jgi:hypothetical protein
MAAILEAYSGEKNKQQKGVRVDKAIETNATIPRIATKNKLQSTMATNVRNSQRRPCAKLLPHLATSLRSSRTTAQSQQQTYHWPTMETSSASSFHHRRHPVFVVGLNSFGSRVTPQSSSFTRRARRHNLWLGANSENL